MKDRRRLSSDILSTLPADIIETILCLLPIKEAARTSILSRHWRYQWTKIPKVVFDYVFQVSTDDIKENFAISRQRVKMSDQHRVFYSIYQVLLLHQGPITEFTLNAYDSYPEIDQIILYLSRRNTLQKLRLSYLNDYKLSLSLLSFHKLADLYLYSCYIRHELTFNGFGSLTTLHLEYVDVSLKMLLHLLASCPLLKSFTMLFCNNRIFPKDDLALVKLFDCLRMIENLTIDVRSIQRCFGQLPPMRELPTSLRNLKYIRFLIIYENVKKGYGLLFLVLLIRSSPKLEKIKLQITTPLRYDNIETVDYSYIKLEHLIELELICVNLEPMLEFLKVILAKSPVLKKVRIFCFEKVASDEKLKMARLVSSFPCVSTGAKIVIGYKRLIAKS